MWRPVSTAGLALVSSAAPLLTQRPPHGGNVSLGPLSCGWEPILAGSAGWRPRVLGKGQWGRSARAALISWPCWRGGAGSVFGGHGEKPKLESQAPTADQAPAPCPAPASHLLVAWAPTALGPRTRERPEGPSRSTGVTLALCLSPLSSSFPSAPETPRAVRLPPGAPLS